MNREQRFCLLTAFAAMTIFTACKEEEQAALNIAGVWETTDVFFTRNYKGLPIKPRKTVFNLFPEREGITNGSGIAVEYFDNDELSAAYFHLSWEVWTRKDGDTGIEIRYDENGNEFQTTE